MHAPAGRPSPPHWPHIGTAPATAAAGWQLPYRPPPAPPGTTHTPPGAHGAHGPPPPPPAHWA